MGNKFTRRRVVVDDRYTRPQGLYQHGDVDHKKLRRLILDAKLAPCYPGADDAATDLDECPICFLFYPSLNRSKCCTKGICTECFLQMKSPQAARTTQCPFCKCPSYAVEYRGAKSIEEKGFEEAEEQKVIEAKIRMRQKELQDEEQRMLRREEDVREGRIPAPSDLLRLNFPNLHGFTIPLGSAEVESALLRDSIPERGLTHGQNEGRLSEGQPQVDHTAIPVVAGGSDSGSRDSQQDVNLVPSANLLASQRSLARRRMGIGSSGGTSMHGQAARVLGASRFNREDEFDLDLEDIMVMEAIWLSIQEQGPMEQESVSSGPGNLVTSDSARTEIDQNSSSGNNDAHPLLPPAGETRDVPAGRSSVTGGLAGAIAALAERQVLSVDSATTRQIHQNSGIGSETGDSSANMASNSIPIVNATQSMFAEVDEIAEVLPAVATAASSDTQVNRVEDLEGENKLTESEPEEESEHPTWIEPQDNHTLDSQIREQGHNMWIEVSLESGRALSPYVREDSRGSRTDWMQGHSSEAVEVVTSFSSSVPSASELPWEAPDFAPVQNMEGTIESQGFAAQPPMVPESFEEQMMLAMALSLAEAQAQSRPRRL